MPKRAKNILFIMYDQLRFDYLSCGGHPHLHTPHMDSLAANGVRFSRCYVQSPVCGPSRMSCYTGRYVSSHGAAWNKCPLKVGELTVGDHLRAQGMDSWLIGKTHMQADNAGLERLGISPDSKVGSRIAECGFDLFLRDDGLWSEGPAGAYDTRRSPYQEYLREKGYPGSNPWHDYANSSVDADGNIVSGWFMLNATQPANIRNEDSETPWLTSQAIEFLKQRKGEDTPWMCHVSYIKPHWPYIVPAPYNSMYGKNQVPQPVRHPAERENPHPVYREFMDGQIGKSFQRDDVRDEVIPAYMGLVKQCDDELGRLLAHLRDTGQAEDTVIVITSDHGDYLGDHWLGEKDLFHEPSVKVPLIIFDPSETANASRGMVCEELVEAIDLTATFIEIAGGEVPGHIVEGRSLLPFLHGTPPADWRDYAVSEYDYSTSGMCERLGRTPSNARLVMIADKRYKFMHAEGFRPMLFDMAEDPDELNDVAEDPNYQPVIEMMRERLADWALRNAQRTTVSDQDIVNRRGGSRQRGLLIGFASEDEVPAELRANYTGKAQADYTGGR